MDDKIGMGRVEHGGSDGACPKGKQIVLCIAKVDEGEIIRFGRGRAKLIPGTPDVAAAHAIGIEGVGFETRERDRMEMGDTSIAFPFFCARVFASGPGGKIGRGIGFCDLAFGLCDARIGAPCDRGRGGGGSRPVENDAVGDF